MYMLTIKSLDTLRVNVVCMTQKVKCISACKRHQYSDKTILFTTSQVDFASQFNASILCY